MCCVGGWKERVEQQVPDREGNIHVLRKSTQIQYLFEPVMHRLSVNNWKSVLSAFLQYQYW